MQQYTIMDTEENAPLYHLTLTEAEINRLYPMWVQYHTFPIHVVVG